MKKPILALCAALAVLALLLGCTGASPTTAPTPTVAPPKIDLPSDVMAIYHKTGGVAGIDQTLTVHHGGLLEFNSRGENPKALQVNEPILIPLRNTLGDPAFDDLAPSYEAQGADLMTYTITARDSTGTVRTVTTTDAANHPGFLGLLIGMFEQLAVIVAKNG